MIKVRRLTLSGLHINLEHIPTYRVSIGGMLHCHRHATSITAVPLSV